MDFLGGMLILIGLATLFVGFLWILVEAFSENLLWGLGTLFIKPVGLIFVVLHWSRAKTPALVYGAGLLVALFGALLVD